jgi:putative acetyltransferase
VPAILRPYRSEDLPAVIEIYSDAVRQIAPTVYTPAQVDAWARYAEQGDAVVQLMSQGHRLVIESETGIEAFALLDPADYVSLLYCRARASRQGHAGRLLQALETEAQRLGVKRVHTAASLVSHSLFLRHGYTVDSPERIERNGITFDRHRMSKAL